MITRSSIAFEDFQGSSIAPQVMPPWGDDNHNDDNEQGNDDYNADNVEDCDSNYDKPDNLHFSCPQPRCSDRQEDTATSPSEDLNISL